MANANTSDDLEQLKSLFKQMLPVAQAAGLDLEWITFKGTVYFLPKLK